MNSNQKARSLDTSHLDMACRFTVLSKFRVKILPNNGQSDWG